MRRRSRSHFPIILGLLLNIINLYKGGCVRTTLAIKTHDLINEIPEKWKIIYLTIKVQDFVSLKLSVQLLKLNGKLGILEIGSHFLVIQSVLDIWTHPF